MAKSEFRFCIGDPHSERSSVWKMWTQKSDVYIQSRMMGSDMKVSLHESGTFQWSMTSEWLLKQPSGTARNADRHITRWQIAKSKESVATQVFRIIIPQSELRSIDTFESLKKVRWLSAPPPSWQTLVECYITPPALDRPDTSNAPYSHLTSLPLKDGRWFVALVHGEEVGASNEALLEQTRKQTIAMVEAEGIDIKPEYRACGFINDPSGTKGLIELVPAESS